MIKFTLYKNGLMYQVTANDDETISSVVGTKATAETIEFGCLLVKTRSKQHVIAPEQFRAIDTGEEELLYVQLGHVSDGAAQ